MPMKYPSHPGEIIETGLEELGVTVSAAAGKLGVSRQHLHNIIAGKSAVTAEMAMRLEQGFGSTAEFWLRLQANYDLAQIRNREEPLGVEPLVPRQAAE